MVERLPQPWPLLFLLTGCSQHGDPQAPVWFEDEAAARGIDFSWQSGHEERHYFPRSWAAARVLDLGEDGGLDLYLVRAGQHPRARGARPPNQLFVNRGGGRLRRWEREQRGRGPRLWDGRRRQDFDEDGRRTCVV
jgi:hypothetical protein